VEIFYISSTRGSVILGLIIVSIYRVRFSYTSLLFGSFYVPTFRTKLLLPSLICSSKLEMRIAGSSVTFAHIYRATRRHIPLTAASVPYRTYYFSGVLQIASLQLRQISQPLNPIACVCIFHFDRATAEHMLCPTAT
jgi:hypothetical protein